MLRAVAAVYTRALDLFDLEVRACPQHEHADGRQALYHAQQWKQTIAHR
jgi:hypothetical protein